MLATQRLARIRWAGLLLGVSLIVGCGGMPSPFKVHDRSPRADVDAPFDPPNTYPEWAYDSTNYVRAVDELTPEPKVNASDPLHYFTNQKIVMVRQPDGYTPEEIPRVAIWWTNNNGFHWNKGGYFGRQQTFFPFEVEEDGDYGLRFVGPGQEPALHSLPHPERVYHVDTVLPEVVVTVDPEKTWYNVGESVAVSWRASDYHLIENPVRVGVLYDFTKRGDNAVELQRDLPDQGTLTYTIPGDALDHEIRFRVDALDRAGNLGIAISYALQVVPVEQQDVDDLMARGSPEPYPSSGSSQAAPATSNSPGTMNPNSIPHSPGTTASVYANQGAARPTPANPQAPMPISGSASTTSPPRPVTQTSGTHWGANTSGSQTVSSSSSSPSSNQPSQVGSNSPASLSTMTPMNPTASPAATTAAPAREIPITIQAAPQPVSSAAPAQHGRDEAAGSSTMQMQDSYTPPSNPDAALPSLEPEQFNNRLSVLTPASAGGQSFPAVGVTHADGLLVPMPATVQARPSFGNTLLAHPWRSLREVVPLALDTVWKLPRPKFGSADLNRLLDGTQMAGGKATQPVAEPGAIGGTVVSVPDVNLGSHVDIQP